MMKVQRIWVYRCAGLVCFVSFSLLLWRAPAPFVVHPPGASYYNFENKHTRLGSGPSGPPRTPSSRGTVLCAHTAERLRRAWTQIAALRQLYGMANESFTIFHAEELDVSSAEVLGAIKRLEALPHVRVESLAQWYSIAYPSNDTTAAKGGLKRFQGFFCKAGALLAAPYDVVALVDLDVVLMDNPFALTDTPTFRDTGSYLFRDRRISAGNAYRQQSAEAYRDRLEGLWRWSFHHPPGRSNGTVPLLPPALTRSPPFTGWSYDYGESAVVVLDKRRHVKALDILQQMMGVELFETVTTGIHGDKEVYWQALALAGEAPGMNALACADVGRRNDNGDACCYHWTNAQWTWHHGDKSGPRIFYVNGDGVEKLVAAQDDTLLHAWVSDPLDYFSNRTRIDYLDTCCNRGAQPLPPYVVATFHAYRIAYERWVLRA